MSSFIFAIPGSVMVGSRVSLWAMKNIQYSLVEMEWLTTAAVVVTKLALLAGCLRILFSTTNRKKMKQNSIIVFVCEHGAAKSILAAAYFNKLAQEEKLNLHAVARGTHPDAELSSKTIAGLQKDGLTPTESIPTKLTREEIESAQQIVWFCDVPDEYHQQAIVEQWLDIPPVSEDYETSRDAIVERIRKLIGHL